MKNKQIVFTKKDTAEFLETEYFSPQENEVLVETVYSAISCGTEKANITGDANIGIYMDENAPVTFPRYGGYSSSGIVREVGSAVKGLKVGDSVVMSWSQHRKLNVIAEENAVKFDPEKLSYKDAAMMNIATFPLAALRKTKLEIGESMIVMGLGILGLIAVYLSKCAGAVPVIAVDPVKERRDKALKFGADYALDPMDENFVKTVKEITGGGVNCAIEVTGLGAGLNQCLDCMAKHGRIALLGCTRDKNFTVDYYRKVHGPGIQLIGAHTMARPSVESYPGYFTQRDDIVSLIKLSAGGRIKLSDMVEEINVPENCGEVYTRLVNDKNFPTVVLFDWRGVDEKN